MEIRWSSQNILYSSRLSRFYKIYLSSPTYFVPCSYAVLERKKREKKEEVEKEEKKDEEDKEEKEEEKEKI